MRIIAGTELDELDIQGIEKGEPLSAVLARRMLLDRSRAPTSLAKRRLETLAYLAREVASRSASASPRTTTVGPLPASKTKAYFHAKFGILEDREGNRLAFIGSDNESAAGWRDNYEAFTVAKSWLPEVWQEMGAPLVDRFEALWNGQPEKAWQVVELPVAVRTT